MKLEISKIDIEGAGNSVYDCPVARALTRKFNTHASVGVNFAALYYDDHKESIHLSCDLSSVIIEFMNSGIFKPGEYDIEQS